MIELVKIDHFTGKPYKKNNKSGAWNVVDYIADEYRITELPNGDRQLTKGSADLGIFKTLKAAKAFAESMGR